MPGKKAKGGSKKKHVSHKKKSHKKGSLSSARRPKVHGSGGYFGDLGKKAGQWLGGAAGDLVDSAVSGLGAYHVKSNTLWESNGPPSVQNSKSTFCMQHREYLGDITGTTLFTLQSYPIQPGVAGTFPWLAAIALCFEQYRIKGMIFEFKSTSGKSIGSTNTAMGTVIMATEYNSQLPLFVSKFQMENHEYSSDGEPSRDILHPIECARGRTVMTELYVRPGVGTTYNPLLYDMGIFQIATVGMQAGVTVIGELWVTYDIEFYKPTIPTSVGGGFQQQHLSWINTSGVPTAAAPFQGLTWKSGGSGTTPVGKNGLDVLAVGRYCLVISAVGIVTSVTVQTATIAQGVSVQLFTSSATTGLASASSFIGCGNGANTVQSVTMYAFDITSPTGGSITLSGGTILGTISSYDVYLFSLGTGFMSPINSRKMVDYDPITLLNQRLDRLFGAQVPLQLMEPGFECMKGPTEQDEKDEFALRLREQAHPHLRAALEPVWEDVTKPNTPPVQAQRSVLSRLSQYASAGG